MVLKPEDLGESRRFKGTRNSYWAVVNFGTFKTFCSMFFFNGVLVVGNLQHLEVFDGDDTYFFLPRLPNFATFFFVFCSSCEHINK